MICKSLLSGKNKTTISKCCMLKFLPSMISVDMLHVFHSSVFRFKIYIFLL